MQVFGASGFTTWGDRDYASTSFFVENLILDYFCLEHFSIYEACLKSKLIKISKKNHATEKFIVSENG